MRYLSLISAAFLALFLFSCEDEYETIAPSINDQELSFKVDGQAATFRALPGNASNASKLSVRADQIDDNKLQISRADATGNTIIKIIANDLPITKSATGYNYVGQQETDARITITSTEMSGSIYCPHVENVDYLVYQGSVKFETITADGTLEGSFYSNKRTDGNPKLEEGKINVKLRIEEI